MRVSQAGAMAVPRQWSERPCVYRGVGTATRLGPSSRVRGQRACPNPRLNLASRHVARRVPDRPEWIHEIKPDGYRLIIQRDGKTLRLWTRNGHDWSDRFPRITEA